MVTWWYGGFMMVHGSLMMDTWWLQDGYMIVT